MVNYSSNMGGIIIFQLNYSNSEYYFHIHAPILKTEEKNYSISNSENLE